MPINLVVPPLGESVTEAVLLRWLKEDGQPVSAQDPVCELETDKANVDLPAPSDGVVRHGKKPGDTVRVGETIGQIQEGGAGVSTQPAAPSAAVGASANASKEAVTKPPLEEMRPSVRRLAEESHLSPAGVAGTGPHGQVIKEDMLQAIEARKSSNGKDGDRSAGAPSVVAPLPVPAPAPVPPSRPGVGAPGKPLPTPVSSNITFDHDDVKRVPMSKIRKRIAERLVVAQQTAAILTTFNEVDCSAIFSIRTKYKERFTEVHGVGLGIMSFFARAVVLALREFPNVNAQIDNDDIVYHNYVHLGIAVSTERGLVVPVLRNAQSMGFAKIESEIKRMAAAARDGKLGLTELTGGTFTITNGGVFGSLLSTPILNPPQSGILGMHSIQKRPMAVGDKVEIRPMMYTALSYDHRLVDGRESVSFLVRLKEYLEDPARLMLEV